MPQKIATIERIHSIGTHPNADTLEKAKVMGWNCVIRKGEYKEGELIVFIHPDTIADASRPEFAFLESKKWRINSLKLRGEVSFGLVMPLSILPGDTTVSEGKEVGELIGVSHYEKPLPQSPDAIGSFPSYLLSITDEDNLKSNLAAYDELVAAGNCYISVKADGVSGTFIVNGDAIRVCSRRLELKDGNNVWWNAVKKHGMIEKLRGLNCAVQFEVVGPGIHGNHMGLREIDLLVFNVKDLDADTILGFDGIRSFCLERSLPSVSSLMADCAVPSFDELVKIANNAKYPNGSNAEGVVVRPCCPVYSESLGKYLSVKVINENYKE